MQNLAKWKKHESSSREASTKNYFGPKAEVYDLTDTQAYWVFSDQLLWKLLDKYCLQQLSSQKDGFHFLDAGCGTARWSSKILEKYTNASATLLDITPEMLSVSRYKLGSMGLNDRAELFETDLNSSNLRELNKKNDLTICFHNVLSFLVDPIKTITHFYDQTAQGGWLALVIPNVYHGAYFSCLTRNTEEMQRVLNDQAIKFAPEVPEMLLFSPDNMRKSLTEIGWKDIGIYGFPVTVYPNMEETQVEGNSDANIKLFDDKKMVDLLSQIEWEFCQNQDTAARGNNLLIIARK
jgi:SAM-dependent methyltransferase